MTDSAFTPSVSDGLLVRYLDGECADEETVRVESLLREEHVAQRLWQLRSASRHFSDEVDALEAPPLPSLRQSPVRPRWHAAAAVGAVLIGAGVAAALPPTRGLVVAGIQRAVGWMTHAPARDARPPVEPGSAIVSVPFAGAELEVEIEDLRRPTTLRITRTSGAEVRVKAPGADLLVLPGGIRVRDTGSLETLAIEVPPGLVTLRVRGGAIEHVVDLTDGALPRELELHPGGG